MSAPERAAGQTAAAAAPDPAASFRNVRKRFGSNVVLDGVDLDVPRGKVVVVMGRSGQGKSLLLRILLGLEPYDAGSVKLLGHEVKELGPREHAQVMLRVGVLFQFGALFDSMTVGENVGFVLRHVLKRPEPEVRRIVRETLLLVGLNPGKVEPLYPSQISGGMRKRVGLARAIAHRPELLLADEPTSGLDPISSDAIAQLVVQLRDRLGVSVLVISHNLQFTFTVADRVAMLHGGRILAEGTPEEIRSSTLDEVRQFVLGRAHGPLSA